MKTKNLFFMTSLLLFGVIFKSSGQNSLQLPYNILTPGAGNVLFPNLLPTPPTGFSPQENVIIGSETGAAHYGNGNTFLGAKSGRYNTSGNYNTFIGQNAGSNNSIGNFNTAIATNGSKIRNYNISMGYFAGATGASDRNLMIGYGCGQLFGAGSATSITGGSNTYLGYVIVPNTPKSTTFNGFDASNMIILADGGGNQSILINGGTNGTLGTGFVGIGLGSNVLPQNSLEIGNAHSPSVAGTAGLRFTNFTNNNFSALTASTTIKKVLSVNKNGDVILVDDQVGTGTGGGITNACALGNFITKTNGTAGNLTCTSIYDDGAGHVGFGFGNTPNTAVNVSINGSSATYGGSYNVSDKKFKKDIQPIGSALEKVMSLEGKTYNWRKDEFKDKIFSDELQYGLIAQEVQKVIPSLVLKAENGDLAMNYIGLIPVLIEAIKEQQTQINDLKSQISDNFKTQNQDLIQLDNTKIISVSPNPSSDMITVSLNIEKTVQNAKLMVFDLNGLVLNSLNISERETNITKTLLKDNFGKGIYIVSLSVNGKSIDSKKIVFN